MPQVKCKLCKTPFHAKPSWLKRGHGIYCSPPCQHVGRRNGKVITCFGCGKESYRNLHLLKQSKSGKYFCSKSCQTKWRNALFVGAKHANWKDGMHAYRSVLSRHGVPQVCKRCETNDKRILAVHHIDRNRKNNKVDNLIWLCHNCHHLIHHHKNEEQGLMVPIV